MKSKCSEDCRLEGTEVFITPQAFLCDICNDLILRDKQAVLFLYTYIDTTFPVYDPDDDSRSLKFMRACTKCGEGK